MSIDSHDNFFQQTFDILKNSILNDNEKFIDILQIFEYLINSKAENSKQIFSSYYSKWIYIFDLYKIDNSYLNNLLHFRRRKKAISSNSIILNSDDFLQFLKSVLYSSSLIIQKQLPNELEDYVKNVEIISQKSTTLPNIAYLQGVLVRKVQTNSGYDLKCVNEQIGNFNVHCSFNHKITINYLWRNVTIGFENLNLINNEINLFELNKDGAIIIEPDYMFDATDIAECYNHYGFDLVTYFSKLIMQKANNQYLVKGMIVNSLFDELIANPNIDFQTAFTKSLHQKPLKILQFLDEQFIEDLNFEMQLHFENLKKIITDLPRGVYSVEPTFISPKYGLQGRLDLFIEQIDDNRKDVIELKSGGFPKNPIQIQDDNGKTFILNVWQNHYAQANCYNLLLDSVYGDRTGTSAILYSSDIGGHPRNVPNLKSFKNEIINFRNNLFAFHRKIVNGDLSVFDIFKNYESKNQLISDDIKEIQSVYNSLDEIEKEYVNGNIRFIFREELTAKIGNNSRREGYASFWRESIDNKKDNFSVITRLKLDDEKSNFDNQHLIFHRNNAEELSFLRIGDPIYLYPEEITNPTDNYILKGFLRKLDNDDIEISLMNKSLNSQYLLNNQNWIIEIDNSDTLIKKQFANITEFMQSPKARRDLLLGRTKSKISSKLTPDIDFDDDYIREIIQKAISANDYYLIQGPPGTGKTSIIIKNLAKYYWEQTKLNVLLLAYTNRAVDEICAVLTNQENAIDFIKIASKEAQNFHQYSLSYLSSIYSLQSLKEKIEAARFFVSTISSIQTNSEIFDLKNFDVVIIDEASQVLEPQIIGVLSKIPKFIIIGDEKQLPAVIQQEQEELGNDSKLSQIGIKKIGTSIFSRLLENAKLNGWDDCYMMLHKQARMHKDIQNLVNYLFYNNQLFIRDEIERQSQEFSQYFINAKSDFLRKIFSTRLIFINSKKEYDSKRNISEAKFISNFIRKIFEEVMDSITSKSIGVISPFRLQCAEIMRSIPQNVRELVSIDTVERFQGSERDIILLSNASNYDYELEMSSNIEIIDDLLIDRKMNVAITRAREHLIILGCQSIFEQSPIHNKLINYIKDKGLYLDLNELEFE
ncbi:MAG: ATP-dependent helicase [Candidatus Kapabacteria bacterium]|nr:ATP-dependent helicase [Candidatus Kapabacteria bacterium]